MTRGRRSRLSVKSSWHILTTDSLKPQHCLNCVCNLWHQCSWLPKATGRNLSSNNKSRMAGMLPPQLYCSLYLGICLPVPWLPPSTTHLCVCIHTASLWSSRSVFVGMHVHMCVHGFCTFVHLYRSQRRILDVLLYLCPHFETIFYRTWSVVFPTGCLDESLESPQCWGYRHAHILCGCWTFELRSSRLE